MNLQGHQSLWFNETFTYFVTWKFKLQGAKPLKVTFDNINTDTKYSQSRTMNYM